MDDDAFREQVLRDAMAVSIRAGARLAAERGETACALELNRLAEEAGSAPPSSMPQLIRAAVSGLERVRASVRTLHLIVGNQDQHASDVP